MQGRKSISSPVCDPECNREKRVRSWPIQPSIRSSSAPSRPKWHPGVEMAVECWMTQFEEAFTNTRLTTLGRLNAVGEILDQYKRLTGKTQLECRRVSAIARS